MPEGLAQASVKACLRRGKAFRARALSGVERAVTFRKPPLARKCDAKHLADRRHWKRRSWLAQRRVTLSFVKSQGRHSCRKTSLSLLSMALLLLSVALAGYGNRSRTARLPPARTALRAASCRFGRIHAALRRLARLASAEQFESETAPGRAFPRGAVLLVYCNAKTLSGP